MSFTTATLIFASLLVTVVRDKGDDHCCFIKEKTKNQSQHIHIHTKMLFLIFVVRCLASSTNSPGKKKKKVWCHIVCIYSAYIKLNTNLGIWVNNIIHLPFSPVHGML